jgi:hypothetical protein
MSGSARFSHRSSGHGPRAFVDIVHHRTTCVCLHCARMAAWQLGSWILMRLFFLVFVLGSCWYDTAYYAVMFVKWCCCGWKQTKQSGCKSWYVFGFLLLPSNKSRKFGLEAWRHVVTKPIIRLSVPRGLIQNVNMTNNFQPLSCTRCSLPGGPL